MYKYWSNHTPYWNRQKREDLCHYMRVVLFHSGYTFLKNKALYRNIDCRVVFWFIPLAIAHIPFYLFSPAVFWYLMSVYLATIIISTLVIILVAVILFLAGLSAAGRRKAIDSIKKIKETDTVKLFSEYISILKHKTICPYVELPE